MTLLSVFLLMAFACWVAGELLTRIPGAIR